MMTTWLRAASSYLILIHVILGLAGCGATRHEIIEYPEVPPGLKLEKAPQGDVARRCGDGVNRMDNGRAVPIGHYFKACYFPAQNLILIAWGWMSLLVHELCHASGRSPLECAEVY